jgi:hypothetical protein
MGLRGNSWGPMGLKRAGPLFLDQGFRDWHTCQQVSSWTLFSVKKTISGHLLNLLSNYIYQISVSQQLHGLCSLKSGEWMRINCHQQCLMGLTLTSWGFMEIN